MPVLHGSADPWKILRVINSCYFPFNIAHWRVYMPRLSASYKNHTKTYISTTLLRAVCHVSLNRPVTLKGLDFIQCLLYTFFHCIDILKFAWACTKSQCSLHGTYAMTRGTREKRLALKGLSHEIDFKNFDKKIHNLA